MEKPSREDRGCEKYDDDEEDGGCTAAAIAQGVGGKGGRDEGGASVITSPRYKLIQSAARPPSVDDCRAVGVCGDSQAVARIAWNEKWQRAGGG
jgi:hypothetical protein